MPADEARGVVGGGVAVSVSDLGGARLAGDGVTGDSCLGPGSAGVGDDPTQHLLQVRVDGRRDDPAAAPALWTAAADAFDEMGLDPDTAVRDGGVYRCELDRRDCDALAVGDVPDRRFAPLREWQYEADALARVVDTCGLAKAEAS